MTTSAPYSTSAAEPSLRAEAAAPQRLAPASPSSVRPRLGLQGWLWAGVVAGLGTALRLVVLAVFGAANDTPARDLLSKWDAKYYLAIAEEGYFPTNLSVDGEVHHFTMAFFPGYPYLVRVLTWAGLPPLVAAVLVNIAATVALAAAAMMLVARINPRWRYNDQPRALAVRVAAAIVVTCAPMTIVMTMPYTEALFGALSLWALVALCDRRWLLAGLLTAAAAATRLTAVDLIAAFGLTVLIWGRKDPRAWTGLFISPLPLLAYLGWTNKHLADAGGYFGIQKENWSSGFDFGVATVKWVADKLTTSSEAGHLLTCLVIITAPLLLVVAWKKVPWPVWFFSAALIANILLSDGIMHSRPRLLLPAVVLLVPFAAQRVTAPSATRRFTWLALAAWAIFGAWFSAYMLAVFPWAI